MWLQLLLSSDGPWVISYVSSAGIRFSLFSTRIFRLQHLVFVFPRTLRSLNGRWHGGGKGPSCCQESSPRPSSSHGGLNDKSLNLLRYNNRIFRLIHAATEWWCFSSCGHQANISSYTANPLALSCCPQGDHEVNAASLMLPSNTRKLCFYRHFFTCCGEL